jgi:hypothetical protein
MPGFRAILRSCCPHWRLSAVLFLSLLSMALFFCADRNNPFADVSNARVHIVDPPFGTAAQGDSLRIFTTYSFNVVIALCEEVDSFCVIIPSNRLGDTLVYRNGDPKAFGAELYPVSFSLCDTGLIPITIRTCRSNGDKADEVYAVRAVSPLKQTTVIGLFGDTLSLATAPVGDIDVWYRWSFGEIALVKSAYPTYRGPAPLIIEPSGTGYLWVSDIRSQHCSPRIPFSFVLSDSTPPAITLAPGNSGIVRGDTVWTGDSTCRFRVRIQDPGFGWVAVATVDQQPFDEQDGSYYAEWIPSVNHRAAIDPLPIVVNAEDHFGNKAQHTFFLMFSDTIRTIGGIDLRLLSPPAGTDFAIASPLALLGIIAPQEGDSLDVRVAVTINGDSVSSQNLSIGGDGVIWRESVDLDTGANTVCVSIVDSLPGIRYDTCLIINYTQSTVDTSPPVIADVTSGGRSIAALHTNLSLLPIRIIAFDQGLGIDSLLINGQLCAPHADSAYIWNDTVFLAHKADGNTITIIAIDKAGNRSPYFTVVTRNNLPVVKEGLTNSPLRARAIYRDTLHVFDQDLDPLVFHLLDSPAGFTLKDSIVTWMPGDTQTGVHTVRIGIYDGFDYVTYEGKLIVIPAQNAPCSLTVASDKGAWQGTALMLDDTMTAILTYQIHDQDPLTADQHTVTVMHGSLVTLMQQDTTRSFSITIDPQQARKPNDTITVIITDQGKSTDSLLVPLVFRTTAKYWAKLYLQAAQAGIAHAVTDFPLLVRLIAPTVDFTRLGGNARDIRFVNKRNSMLPFQVEHWDSAGGVAEIWVLVDTIHPATDNDWIEMQLAPTADSVAGFVFDSVNGFGGVWHLNNSHADASSSSRNGTNHGCTPAAAIIAGGQSFGGGMTSTTTKDRMILICE